MEKNYEIKGNYAVKAEFEMNVEAGENSYLVIYGKHINGGFCCIPNWGWSCEMSGANNVSYNADKLMACGASEMAANAIACAIQEVHQSDTPPVY